jgi:hypothetical protein
VSPGSGVGSTNQIPQNTLYAMYGDFVGRLCGYDEDNVAWLNCQPYAFSFGPSASFPGYPSINFSSSGPVGSVSFEAPMGVVLNGLYGSTYSFVSGLGKIDAFSPYPVKIELTLAIGYNGQLAPAQSKISIKDCAFSQSVCSNDVQNVFFAGALERRP